ncbi:MAG: polyprenyl synthetase family protein [Roseiflexaceae bacterium]|nr:polyprenyl synthetase family protein [Roseiflexaceae bacterium]
MATLPIPSILGPDLAEVERAIAERLHRRPMVEQIAAPYAQTSGPRLRAALVLLSAQIGNYQLDRTIHAATAVELIQAASRMHDSLVDPLARRHDAVSDWPGMYGNVALMVGDYLFALAASEMALAPDARIIGYYSRSVMAFCEAALLPTRTLDPIIARQQYFDGIGHSSAVLVESACKAGAVCGELTSEQIDALGRFGYALGLALRINDDVLAFQADDSVALHSGSITLPLIYAAEANPSQGIAFLEQDAHTIVSEVRRLGGDRLAMAEGYRYAEQAMEHLMALPEVPARHALAAITEALRSS